MRGTALMAARADEGVFRDEPAITLDSGALTAVFLPRLGMTGVSLRFRDREHLALPGGLGGLRAGQTMGLPLLAPWANRLSSRRYRASGIDVDLSDLPLKTDPNGLPIHGLLVGDPGWQVGRLATHRGTARVRASVHVDAPAFPFPHRIEVSAAAAGERLAIETTLIPTGRRRVPVAFGWHPYLTLPGTSRGHWRLRLPKRSHLVLDRFGIPSGEVRAEPQEEDRIGRRTFDDLYALGRDRQLAFEIDDLAIELHCGREYPYAQVWVPPGRPFAALEPMTAATNALVDGRARLVRPGETFTARFELRFTTP